MPEDRLARYARVLVWAAPLWAILLFLGTLEQQPSPQTAFPEYATFITTNTFLVSHLVASLYRHPAGPVATQDTVGLHHLVLHALTPASRCGVKEL